jgi:dGTP triphosphohydrolase
MTDATPYLSAAAALVGTFVGGITSVATSWLGQQRQTKEQRKAREKEALQELYKQFIENASRLYLDALEHNTTEISKLVDIYSTLNRMRVLSSPKVVAAADSALRVIVGVYATKTRHSPESGKRSGMASWIRCAPSVERATKSSRTIDRNDSGSASPLTAPQT